MSRYFLSLLWLYFAESSQKRSSRRALLKRFDSPEHWVESFQSPEAVLSALQQIPKEKLDSKSVLSVSKKAEAEFSRLEKMRARVISLLDPEYPPLLAATSKPSPILFVRGKSLVQEGRIPLAFVGTRYPSDYGRRVVEMLVRGLDPAKFCLISGFARGIDTLAHQTALRSGLFTIGVWGTGLDRVYPPENRALAERLAEEGAILTQFPLGSIPEPWHFPARNEVISGMSRGVLVVEAPLKSGSLLTAQFALDQGREVFSVPGSIFSKQSEGCHELLAQGAKLVARVEDLLEEFEREYPKLAFHSKKALKKADKTDSRFERENAAVTAPAFDVSGFDPDEKKVWDLLGTEPVSIDALVEKSGLSAASILSILTGFVLQSLVEERAGKCFVRS